MLSIHPFVKCWLSPFAHLLLGYPICKCFKSYRYHYFIIWINIFWFVIIFPGHLGWGGQHMKCHQDWRNLFTTVSQETFEFVRSLFPLVSIALSLSAPSPIPLCLLMYTYTLKFKFWGKINIYVCVYIYIYIYIYREREREREREMYIHWKVFYFILE